MFECMVEIGALALPLPLFRVPVFLAFRDCPGMTLTPGIGFIAATAVCV